MTTLLLVFVYLLGVYLASAVLAYTNRPKGDFDGFIMCAWFLVLMVWLIAMGFIILSEKGRELGLKLRG